MPGEAQAVTAVSVLLTRVLGFAIDQGGYEQLSRDNKLKMIGRGLNAAIEKNDWATCDLLFANYRELCRETGP